MAEPRFEMETHFVVYDNDNGQKVIIRPDSDGLGLVEVDGGVDFGRMVFPAEIATRVAMALARVVTALTEEKVTAIMSRIDEA